jgi:hypothetical protein
MTGNSVAQNRASIGLGNVAEDRNGSVAQGSTTETIKNFLQGVLDRSEAGGLYNPRNREIGRALAI